MDFKLLTKALSIKLNKKRKHFKGAAKSYVSLFLVVILGVVSTTAWLTVKDSVNVTSPTMEMRSAAGIQDSSLQVKQTQIKIENFRMEEASSVDGRNIYFPTPYTNNVNDAANATVTMRSGTVDSLVDWSATNSSMETQTKAMRFREGNAGDKHINYAYEDAQVSSSGADTNVWIKGYKVKIGDNVYEDKIDITKSGSKMTQQNFPNPYSCPVRIAIIDDSGHTPKVFDPAARLKEQVNNTMAVYSTTADGTPTLQSTKLDSFSSYYYGTNNPLFVVPAGKTITLTVVAWLEGTHPYAKDYIGKEMTFSIEIETNVTQMEEIYLHDWTIGDQHGGVTSSNYKTAQTWDGGHWLTGDVDIAMQYYDTSAEVYKTTVMTELNKSNLSKSDVEHGVVESTGKDANGCTVFKAAIPKDVSTDISFYRLSKSTDDVYPGTIFNSWHTYSGVNNALTDTAKSWRILGNLAETRQIGSSASLYTHYYAIRGNGYSKVEHNDSIRYEKWLSPCIGYWGTASAPVSR